MQGLSYLYGSFRIAARVEIDPHPSQAVIPSRASTYFAEAFRNSADFDAGIPEAGKQEPSQAGMWPVIR